MSDDAVGPQRATPKTCRQIEAQTKQAKAELATDPVLTREACDEWRNRYHARKRKPASHPWKMKPKGS